MKRRETLKLFGAAAVAAAIGVAGIPGLSFAQDQKKMVTVVKIAGIPWFNALENGVKKAGTDFGIDTSVVGPANLDPAQQVKLLEDLIAQKVDVIGLVPIDVKVAEPVPVGVLLKVTVPAATLTVGATRPVPPAANPVTVKAV